MGSLSLSYSVFPEFASKQIKHVKSAKPMEVSMPEAHKKAYRHPKYKTSYCIKNWSDFSNPS
jgi:hypothetical protein